MRFDDMLATVLARQPERLAARVMQWRQLVDLVAQRRLEDDAVRENNALLRLAELRPDVPVAVRRDSARAIAGRPLTGRLVAFMADDMPQVAGEILGRVVLPDAEWTGVLPRLSPTGRGFLRHRRDLSPTVTTALETFGSTDFALAMTARDPVAPVAPPLLSIVPESLPSSREDGLIESTAPVPQDAVEPFEPASGEGQIRAIISRIARFRDGRGGLGSPVCGADEMLDEAGLFHFETGVDGVIGWVEGVPRGALIGETIARAAVGGFGVDGQAPGAFRRRAAFRDARLLVAGAGPASGEWRIAGVPVFATSSGRFLGYRGTGRRPRTDERAEGSTPVATTVSTIAGLAPDSLRQLVHELRTPLNAIGGFAEMIRRQMRGPVSGLYRDRAQRIADQASQLLAAVDDLDVAARLDSARIELQRVPVDVGALLASICADYRELARNRGGLLVSEIPVQLVRALGDATALRRMIARLVASCTALIEPGETIVAALNAGADDISLSLTRPARLVGVADADLLDPGYGPEGDWPDAPLLGLGFSLHLVRRLVQAAGGALRIENACFSLHLPLTDDTTDGRVGG